MITNVIWFSSIVVPMGLGLDSAWKIMSIILLTLIIIVNV